MRAHYMRAALFRLPTLLLASRLGSRVARMSAITTIEHAVPGTLAVDEQAGAADGAYARVATVFGVFGQGARCACI